jgi:hypothetical protein
MTPIVLTSRVGSDGVLHLTLPLGAAEANHEVNVTIEPARPVMSQEEWRNRVLSTAGSIPDPTFVRHDQGDYEERTELP